MKNISEEERYEVEKEDMTISKASMDRMLKEKDPGSLIAMYLFYYSVAKWQSKKLGQPMVPYWAWATNSFVGKGLKWGQQRVVKTRQTLERLSFIETRIKRDNKNVIIGHFIKVKFVKENDAVPDPCKDLSTSGLQTANTKETLIGNTKETLNKILVPENLSDKPISVSGIPSESIRAPWVPTPTLSVIVPPEDQNKGWSKIVFSIWKKHFGILEGWKLKTVKPLVEEFGIARVSLALEEYTRSCKEPKYASLRHFAETFNNWDKASKQAEWYNDPSRYAKASKQ